MSREQRGDGAQPAEPVRIDKWLFAARFFKSRSLAAEAIGGGKLQVNGDRAKPSREVKPGDTVWLRLGPYEHTVVVLIATEHRGPAKVAATLYEETADSKTARAKHAWTLKHAGPVIESGAGRPTKKDRRIIDKLRG
ncbi:MAG: RNA-binding S4 domain-containing protein [Gemmatimonadetes bacterium]|nr:RNA-binding S4 domain-containing protein [Gemmatimonadota bacterium]